MEISKETQKACIDLVSCLGQDILKEIKKDMAKEYAFAISADKLSERVGKAISGLANRATLPADKEKP